MNKQFEKGLEMMRQDPLMGLEENSIKVKYGNRFYELRAIINKYDPMGIISLGCPQDEYEAVVE